MRLSRVSLGQHSSFLPVRAHHEAFLNGHQRGPHLVDPLVWAAAAEAMDDNAHGGAGEVAEAIVDPRGIETGLVRELCVAIHSSGAGRGRSRLRRV
jgi:hypothetical protein